MTIWNASEQLKEVRVSNGLIGDIRDAKKRGYYLTPFGWLLVSMTYRTDRGVPRIEADILSYDCKVNLCRYNSRMTIEVGRRIPTLLKLNRNQFYRTGRGFA